MVDDFSFAKFPWESFPWNILTGMILQVPRPGCVVWVTSSAQLHNYITPSTSTTVILTAHCRRRKLRFLTKLPFLGNVWCDIRKNTSFCLSFCPKNVLFPSSLSSKNPHNMPRVFRVFRVFPVGSHSFERLELWDRFELCESLRGRGESSKSSLGFWKRGKNEAFF